MNINGVGENIGIPVPDGFQNNFTGQKLTRIQHQELQKNKLFIAKMDLLTFPMHFMGVTIELKIPDPESLTG